MKFSIGSTSHKLENSLGFIINQVGVLVAVCIKR